MKSNSSVYCRLLRDSIPTTLCASEQGQKACTGCNAQSRLCETCGKVPSTNPTFGLCEPCLQMAISKKWCEKCRQARSATGALCSSCYATLLKSNAGEHIGIRQTSTVRAVDVTNLLRKVEHLVRPATVTVVLPELVKPMVIMREAAPIAQPSLPPLEKNAWYWKWSLNADRNPKRIFWSHRILWDKPKPVLPQPDKPSDIPQDVWLDKLYEQYREPVVYEGIEYGIVQDFRQTMPVDPAHIERFILDPRVIMLTHSRSRKQKPSQHCVICPSITEAHFIHTYLSTFDYHEFRLF